MSPRCETLGNGLRVVLVPCEAESVAVGLFIASGSRHETARTAGISHFIEHMLFKGTPTRRPIDITRAIEGRGGNFNACTGEESTCYFAHLPYEYLGEAVDILSDMYLRATIPADEFAREKQVVIEEIKMYADEPDSVAMENLQRALFPGSMLGAPVAGTPASLRPMKQADLRRYIKSHYLPSNTVVVIVGNFDETKALKLVGAAFGAHRRKSTAIDCDRALSGAPLSRVTASKDVSQTQLALGYRTFGIRDDRKYAATVMDAILGRGMSSRLFQEVREKKGLSYDISSRMQFFQDAGMFTVTAGLDPAKAKDALATIDRELKRICEKPVPAAELKRTKDYLVGNFRLSHEKVTSKLFFYGQTMLSFGRLVTTQEQVEGIRAVTAADVKSVARSILRPCNRAVSWVVPKALAVAALALAPFLTASADQPAFMTRDDGVEVTDVPSWKPRMFEITRKYERRVFGLMPQTPRDLTVECLSEDGAALCGKATAKRIRFSWGRVYDRGCFEATAVMPNRTGASATFLYVCEHPVAAHPVPTEDWPVDEIIRRGYATVAFDGSQLTAEDAKDAVVQRAWALRMLYDWACKEPRLDEMTTGPVGCGPLDGVASLWAGSYDWRFYLCVAAQCGLDKSYAELAANNTPGLLYTCSAGAESPAEIAGDRALAEDVTPAWTIYGGLPGFRGNTDWHLREGPRGLTREDWGRFMDFTDRHGWSIGDNQVPTDDVPPLLVTYDGRQTVSTRETWEKVRRPEIVKFFTDNVYGRAPGKPSDLRFEQTAPDRAMTLVGGTRVVRKLLKAVWTAPLGKGEIPFQAYLPEKDGKLPAVLFLSLSKKRMDPDRKNVNDNWDVEQICARGYAAVGVYYEDISPDRPHDFDVPPFNLYARPADRSPNDWCAIAAWAWGLSRVMDWIETEPAIDTKRVIVGGHSRGGKTALWAGVSDTRFAMSVPFGSGRTGMLLNHIRTPFPTETIALINSGQPHWFTPVYKSFNNRDLELGFDHHQLAACLAPRLLFVCEGTGDMSRYGDWYSLVLASPAWELYGMKGLPYGRMPGIAERTSADGQGFHLRHGPHAVRAEDWKAVLDFADAHLR